MADSHATAAPHRTTVPLHKSQYSRLPSSGQILGFFTSLVSGGILLFVGGLTLTGIIIISLLLTSVFILFSPVLLPAGIVLFLSVAGALTVGAGGVAAASAISWIYNYFKGRHPAGAEHVDSARASVEDTVGRMKRRPRELAGALKSKKQEATSFGT